MLRNTVDKKDAKYQITQWIQNDAPSYQKQLQNLSDADIRKLVDYVATDVRNEFHKLEADKDSQLNLELLKTIMRYITLEKVTWHFNIDGKTNQYSLTLGNMDKVFWMTVDFDYEKNQDKDYDVINPARFVWKSDVSEIALQIVNDQPNWFFTNQPASELIVPQQILDKIKQTIVAEFEHVFDIICELVQKQAWTELS